MRDNDLNGIDFTEQPNGSATFEAAGITYPLPAAEWQKEKARRASMTRIEMVGADGSAKVTIDSHIIDVVCDDYEHDTFSNPTQRDAAIIRAAQYKLNYGDN